MSKKMKIRLLPNGEIQMETIGVKGKKCLEYAKIFQKLVNARIKDTKLTDEYYETENEISTTDNAQIHLD